MTNSLPMKTRAMMYEQQLDHLPRLVDEMYRRIETLAPKRYAGIVHDSDTTDAGRPAAAHLHVMMEFQNPRSLNSIAKLLGDKPERIEAWKAGVENGFPTCATERMAHDPSISTTPKSCAPISITQRYLLLLSRALLERGPIAASKSFSMTFSKVVSTRSP